MAVLGADPKLAKAPSGLAAQGAAALGAAPPATPPAPAPGQPPPGPQTPPGAPGAPQNPYAGWPTPASPMNPYGGYSGVSVTPQNPSGEGALAAPLQQFWDLFNAGVIAPQQAQSQQQIDALTGQIGLAGAGYDYGVSQAQQDYANSQAQLGVQSGDIAFQSGLLPQQQQLTQQQFGLSGQSLANQLAQARYNEGQQEISTRQGATAAGAINTPGLGQQLGQLQQQEKFTEQGIGLSQQQLGVSQQQQGLQYQQSQHQLADMAANLGISETEVKQRLQNTINQLGIQDATTTDQLLGEIAKVREGEYSPIASFLSDIYSMSGLLVPSQ